MHATRWLFEQCALPSRPFGQLICLVATMFLFFAGGSALAASSSWRPSPVSGDWNTASNWSPMTVPNGAADTATFDSSFIPDVSISANTEVNGIVFNSLAHLTPFTIVSPAVALTVSGAGITNNSGVPQTFVTPVDASGNFRTIVFKNKATAGPMTAFTNSGPTSFIGDGLPHGGQPKFFDTSTAGSAAFNNNAGQDIGGSTSFFNFSTTGRATITDGPSPAGPY